VKDLIVVDPRGHYSNPPSPGEMANQSGVTWPDLINPRVRAAIGELYDYVVGGSRDSATIKCRRVPPDGLRQVQRRLPPEEIEELVATYLAGAPGTRLGWQALHSPDHRLGPSLALPGIQTRAGADPRSH